MFFLNWVERREGKRSGNLKADEASGSLALRRELCTNLAATASPPSAKRAGAAPARDPQRSGEGSPQTHPRHVSALASHAARRRARAQAEAEPGASRRGWGMPAAPAGTLTAPRAPEAISLPPPALPASLHPRSPPPPRAPTKRRFPRGSAVSQCNPSGRRSPWKLPLPPLAGEGPGWGLRRAPALVRQGQHCDTATAGLRRNSERLWGDEITALRDGISKLH